MSEGNINALNELSWSFVFFRSEQLTKDVWDYIFFKEKPYPSGTNIPEETLQLV